MSTGGGGSGGSGGSNGSGEAGENGTGGVPPDELPACLESATVGAFNAAGQMFGATETATDWTWPSPVSSMQWDVMVEREIVRASPTALPTSGYYFAYQFSFLEGVAGFVGIQAEGVYQLAPPDSPAEFIKMAVFWLSGPPLAAELGDIAYPSARVAPTTAAGVSYLTIHARFEWEACRVYRFRVAPHSTEADGSTWYGAWILDTTSQVETLLGRMLLPANSGLLAPLSMSRTLPINYGTPSSCDVPAQESVIFGRPRTSSGDIVPTLGSNRFVNPRCASSRFTEFDAAVRHELGVPP